MQSLGQGPNPLELVDGEERVQVCSPQCIGGSEVAIRSAVLTGMGIAALPDSMVHADLAAGDLVRVLPACTVAESSVELCLFYLHRDKMSSRCRTFVDLCVDYFKGDAPAMSETSMPREIPGEVALAECGLLS
jgi:DNA-binding transcriptional LysR family regulator